MDERKWLAQVHLWVMSPDVNEWIFKRPYLRILKANIADEWARRRIDEYFLQNAGRKLNG